MLNPKRTSGFVPNGIGYVPVSFPRGGSGSDVVIMNVHQHSVLFEILL